MIMIPTTNDYTINLLNEGFLNFIIENNFNKEELSLLIIRAGFLSKTLLECDNPVLKSLAKCYVIGLCKNNKELQTSILTICLAMTTVKLEKIDKDTLGTYLKIVEDKSKTLSMWDEEIVVKAARFVNDRIVKECENSIYEDLTI